MCQAHKLPSGKALGQYKGNTDFTCFIGAELWIKECRFRKVFTYLYITRFCQFFRTAHFYLFLCRRFYHFFLEHHISNSLLVHHSICGTPASNLQSSCKSGTRTASVTYHHSLHSSCRWNDQFTIFQRNRTEPLQREINIQISIPHIGCIPISQRNHIMKVHSKVQLMCTIDFIQRSIIHSSQHFSLSRASIRIKYRQFPFLLLSRTEFVTERSPFQLQLLFRGRFHNPCIMTVKSAIFHKCHTYQNAVTIFLLIREAETDHRVRKLYTFAFQALISCKYIIKQIDILFAATYIYSSRRCCIKFQTILIEPIRYHERRTLVVQ